MVESIQWQDGCLLFHGPQGDHEVCDKGWLVIAIEAAIE